MIEIMTAIFKLKSALSLQILLHINNIKSMVQFESDVFQTSGMYKALVSMEGHALLICIVNLL